MTDVLVIGGGVIGLTVARKLAKSKLSVTLLERDRIGQHASWASAGVLAAAAWHRRDAIVTFQRNSLRMWPQFCAEIHEESGINPEYVNCGGMELILEDQQYRMAQSETQAAMKAGHLDFRNEPVLQFLSPEEACGIEPSISRDCLGIKYATLTSHIRTPRMLRAVAAAAQAAGATIIENCTVIGLQRNGDRVTGVTTMQGPYHAGRVVLCAGTWSSQIDAELGKLVQVYPVRGQLLLLRMPPGIPGRIVKHRKTYVVPRLDGHVLVGSTEEHESGFECFTTTEGLEHLRTSSLRIVPGLQQATIVRGWAGLRPGTPDRRPYIGLVPGYDGLLAATGHFRTGFGLAPLTADVINDFIMNNKTEHNVSKFSPGRTFGSKT